MAWETKPIYSVSFHETAVRGEHWSTSRAEVPVLPSEIREQFPSVMDPKGKFLLLWEASWAPWERHAPKPPRAHDPALLEHVSGSLFKVRAVWDITLVELAALRPVPRF